MKRRHVDDAEVSFSSGSEAAGCSEGSGEGDRLRPRLEGEVAVGLIEGCG